jgi:hypothetical protein
MCKAHPEILPTQPADLISLQPQQRGHGVSQGPLQSTNIIKIELSEGTHWYRHW